MPEATSAGGGYSCQLCGMTYPTESEVVQHGRDQHPDRPVTWGDTREETVRTEPAKSDTQRGMEGMADKMKAGAKAVGEKVAHPEKDLGAEYEQKKAEEGAK